MSYTAVHWVILWEFTNFITTENFKLVGYKVEQNILIFIKFI